MKKIILMLVFIYILIPNNIFAKLRLGCVTTVTHAQNESCITTVTTTCCEGHCTVVTETACY